MTDDDKISYIIKHEGIITHALIKGHSAHDNDEFKEIREELKKLRKELGLT
jgi:predicted SprT family Zn-dependent metalloprotease